MLRTVRVGGVRHVKHARRERQARGGRNPGPILGQILANHSAEQKHQNQR